MVSGGLKFAAAECLNRAAASLRPFTSTSTRNAAVVQVKIEGEIRLAKSFKLFVFRAILTCGSLSPDHVNIELFLMQKLILKSINPA